MKQMMSSLWYKVFYKLLQCLYIQQSCFFFFFFQITLFDRRRARSCWWVCEERRLEEIYLSPWFTMISFYNSIRWVQIFNVSRCIWLHFARVLVLQCRYNLRQYWKEGENDSSRVDRLGYIAFIIILSHRSILLDFFSCKRVCLRSDDCHIF